MANRILVSHPHAAAASSGLAAALATEGRLASYVTGLASVRGSASGAVLENVARWWPVLSNRLQPESVEGRLRAMPLVETLARGLGAAASGVGLDLRPYEALFYFHDRCAALGSWPKVTAAVYAYEDGALSTFARARAFGRARIWDLPTPHHRFLPSLLREEQHRWDGIPISWAAEPPRKIRRKDAELEMADVVCVASSFTRSTLPDQPRRPVLVIPYGFPTADFPSKSDPPDGSFVALSVGSQSVRKGTHYLLRAWKNAGLRDARLRLVGPMLLPGRFLHEFTGLFEHVPHVPRSQLAQEYRAANLLIFPTLGDGFGLVIQEAMSSGTPVLTTPCGGGPECITDGREGWIVPARDTDALTDRIRQAASNRGSLAQMGRAARRRAEAWTWNHAARKLVAGLTGLGLL